jgi:enoyl-CoA hydratase/carnithine racemase
MTLVDYRLDEHVALVTMASGENRFNPEFLDALSGVLDAVENETDATTLVVHSAHEKIWSNGIDLEWLAPVLQQNDLATVKQFFYQLNQTFRRLVTYPLVTIAAISGHAFAGGAIFSCAFDFRWMRSDRGFFCLPEVDLGMPFLPGMNALLRRAVPEPMLREMQLTGVRLTAEMCRAHNIVQQALPQERLLDETMQFAQLQNKRRPVVAHLKKQLNLSVLHAIDVEDVDFIEAGRFHIG